MKQPKDNPRVKRGEVWFQIGGDMNPGAHGAILARFDGGAIEVREIEPVLDSVGEREGLEVGFPFWTREAWYDATDLDPDNPETYGAQNACDFDPEDFDPDDPDALALAMAEVLLRYGYKVEPGPSGWAKDVTPDKVYWWGNKLARGWRYLQNEDVEYRQLLRERAA